MSERDEREALAELMAIMTSGVILENAKAKIAETVTANGACMPAPGTPLANLIEGGIWAGVGATVEYLLARDLLVDDPENLDKVRAEMGL